MFQCAAILYLLTDLDRNTCNQAVKLYHLFNFNVLLVVTVLFVKHFTLLLVLIQLAQLKMYFRFNIFFCDLIKKKPMSLHHNFYQILNNQSFLIHNQNQFNNLSHQYIYIMVQLSNFYHYHPNSVKYIPCFAFSLANQMLGETQLDQCIPELMI